MNQSHDIPALMHRWADLLADMDGCAYQSQSSEYQTYPPLCLKGGNCVFQITRSNYPHCGLGTFKKDVLTIMR